MSEEKKAAAAIIILVTLILIVLFSFGGAARQIPKRECTAIGNAIPIGCKPGERVP